MRAILQEECQRRGLDVGRIPGSLQEAKEWTARNIAQFGQQRPCHLCSVQSTACLYCSTCDLCFCRSCMGVRPGELWSLGFQCPSCIVHDASLDPHTPVEPALERLAKSLLATVGASLKPSTWALYQRCISDMLRFASANGLRIFPVDSVGAARGIAMFFEHLRELGFSWARIAHYRAALRSLCAAGNLDDPFETFPCLKAVCEGLKKRITLRTRRKEGVTLKMVVRLLEFWEQSELVYRRAGKTRLADAALRHQVAVILGWWGMRRASELFVNKDGTMGLRKGHMTWVTGSHVTFFIQAMKNDPYGCGNEVVFAWETASGVRIGETMLRYWARLEACGIPDDAPFFLPARDQGFVVPAPGRSFRPTDCLRKGLQQCFQEFADPALLSRYSWHSLRRGGASHACRIHLDKHLVMGHGLWKSEDGVQPYLSADLEGKLAVTRAM
mmetsp:Transcript_51080/g.103871  ORF Transcript_51080/g.103871 Transcript_51080/m.103871 type:complete len:443 (-) Transcript_51080:248-1576(-)